jgi:hypothetical protein
MQETMQNRTISGFPDSRHPAGSQGVEFQEPFMRTFAPCFASAEDGQPVYLLSRGANQRNGTTGNPSRNGSDIVKTDENTTFDRARIGAALLRGSQPIAAINRSADRCGSKWQPAP